MQAFAVVLTACLLVVAAEDRRLGAGCGISVVIHTEALAVVSLAYRRFLTERSGRRRRQIGHRGRGAGSCNLSTWCGWLSCARCRGTPASSEPHSRDSARGSAARRTWCC
uniref:Secreted protein n=1 Tax=Arundo donax TaxID=35708 RepID=A0A0A9FAW6_ARUDO